MKRTSVAIAVILFSVTTARATSLQFPIIGVIGGATTYVPIQDSPPSLAAYDLQSLGGRLIDGEQTPYRLRFRMPTSLFKNCGPILNCSKLATYDVIGPKGFSDQQSLILVFLKPIPITYQNADDHADYISGKNIWRVRYLNETDEDVSVYLQTIVSGKCESTTKYRISGEVDGAAPWSKKEDVICGKYTDFKR